MRVSPLNRLGLIITLLIGVALAVYLGLLPFVAMAPVAILTAQNRATPAIAFLATAAAAGALFLGGVAGALLMAFGAAAGLPLGYGARYGWRYGWILAAVTVCFCVGYGLGVLLHWDDASAHLGVLLSDYAASFTEAGRDPQNDAARDAAQYFLRLRENLPYVTPGFIFTMTLLLSAAVVSLFAPVARAISGAAGPADGLKDARTPEWAVWLAIVAAGLCFADRYWPNDVMRFIGWNAGISLGALYWLNGVSIIAYGLSAFHFSMAGVAAGVMAATLIQIPLAQAPAALIGLFDTWGDFRAKIDRFIQARERLRQEFEDDDF